MMLMSKITLESGFTHVAFGWFPAKFSVGLIRVLGRPLSWFGGIPRTGIKHVTKVSHCQNLDFNRTIEQTPTKDYQHG